MYTESLKQLLVRARTGKPAFMELDRLVELAYKSGAHDEFYKQSKIIIECEKTLEKIAQVADRSGHVYEIEMLCARIIPKIKAIKDTK